MTKQHESAVSLLSNPASCSAPPYCEHLVRQQAQLPWAQHRPQGIFANRHTAPTSLRSSRDLCAADYTCRVCLLPKMTRAPPACSCCTACGRAFESQLVSAFPGWPAAFHRPSRKSARVLEGSDRICRDGGTPCRDDGSACRDGGRSWSMNSTRGSLPQAGKAQLAGNTSRALARMALSLRYSRSYYLILESHCPKSPRGPHWMSFVTVQPIYYGDVCSSSSLVSVLPVPVNCLATRVVKLCGKSVQHLVLCYLATAQQHLHSSMDSKLWQQIGLSTGGSKSQVSASQRLRSNSA